MRRPIAPVLVLTSVLLLLTGWVGPPGAQAQAQAEAPVRYELPVEGGVLRPFEAPGHEYGPGHRGVDLVARPGTAVRAAAGGEVTFAGLVAGERWVSVRHADGVVTSYGAVSSLAVRTGQVVDRGQVLGTATGTHGDELLRPEAGLHWGARRGGVYIDPLELLDAPLPRPTLVEEGGWWASHRGVEGYADYAGGSRFGLLATPSPVADRPGFLRAPSDARLLLIPGYGTAGPEPFLDGTHLGYAPEDVTVFSYGGCEPTERGCRPLPYGGQDTDLSIEQAADLLDAQLRAMQRARPHRPVDLLGHSMGGDVAVHWATTRYDPNDLGLPPVRAIATIATPHGGSGTASIPRAIGDDAIVGRVAELGREGLARSGWGTADRMSFASQPLDRYGAPIWSARPERDPEALERKGVRVGMIAGSRDLVVGRTDAGFAGDALVLPGGHSSVLETEAVRQALHAFYADRDFDVDIGFRVGVGSDIVSDVGRTLGTVLDVWPARSVVRAIEAGNVVPRVVYEYAKSVVGGPTSPNAEPDPSELPMAPDAPLDPLDAYG